MSKICKKSIAFIVMLVFMVSLVPFSAMAEKTSATITGENKVRGYFTGNMNNLTGYVDTKYPTARNGSDSNRRITYIQYNVADYLKYADTEFTFSLRLGGQYSDEKAYKFDIYLLKGTYVDVTDGVATTLLNMNCMRDNSVVQIDAGLYKKYPLNEESNLLIKIGSFENLSGARSVTETYSVTEEQLKSAVGTNGWVTFIINAVGDDVSTIQQSFSADHADTHLEVTYDENSVYADNVDANLTIEEGVATANVAVTNGTAQDASYKLYLAEYNNEELIQLVPMDMSATKYFKTTKTLTANVASGNKVKLFVWSADGITPVAEACEK